MATLKKRSHHRQSGHSLVQSLIALLLSILVVLAAFTVFGWVQLGHHQLQAQSDVQQRLNTAMQLLRERVHRSGAAALLLDTHGQGQFVTMTNTIQGSNTSLSLLHNRSLTSSDCQGHETSTLTQLNDDFKRSSHQELSCKDSLRTDTIYQALVDGISGLAFLYAEELPGSATPMQWRNAADVINWNAIRGVQICVQADADAGSQMPSTLTCNNNQPLKPNGLAWRGVAVFRHGTP